ncbi:hypothetical protein [Magnetospirillum sulfuroxidans]|uniref:Uncharacterized protein n=1 Tax=Magnetospirillum sulfuroxidans TaxID=611300 RepID=A0ABS5IEQ7_9PROT|nr:hypothetical protein [Magnetospirillum sulfuroxidans]MBR9972672.1 hypothetical protein [Magnetospirillum sulfuroxidans]
MSSAACSNNRACHAISSVVLDVVQALLRERSVNGKVDLADVERLIALVRRGPMTLDPAYAAQEEKCRAHHSKPKGNIGARANPFQRLMVRPLEPLLGEVLPRPLLANYFHFVDTALGPAARDELDRDCRALIQALLVVHGNNLTWDHFYGDHRSTNILRRALHILAAILRQPQGPAMWRSHMGRPTGDAPPLPTARLDLILDTLLQTHHGLAA